MIKILLGTLAGLLLGVGGTLAYDHYLGAGSELAQVQAKVASDSTDLTQATQSNGQLKSEVDSLSAQVKQVLSHDEELQGQVDQLKKTATPAPDTASPFAGMIKAQMLHQFQNKLALLKSRLNLTPEQEAAIQAAMDREEKKAEEMTTQMMQGGKIDPQTAQDNGGKTVDQTLNDILTPDQKTAYQQMKTDQNTSLAETSATYEMNQAAPLLQLTDAQKDQVFNALYQLDLDNTNPDKVKAMTSGGTSPAAIMDAQAQAKENALAQILTPAQQAQYHQQLQTQLEMQKAMLQKFTPPPASTP